MKPRTATAIALSGLACGGLCLLACLVLAGAAYFGAVWYADLRPNSALRIGATAPDFELTTLDGKILRPRDFRGQPVLLTFGA